MPGIDPGLRPQLADAHALKLERQPSDIEARSFEIISDELARRGVVLDPRVERVVKRAIHATADFSYAHSLAFLPGPEVVDQVCGALQAGGVTIVTDTQMALAGVSRAALGQLGCVARCFMGEAGVAQRAQAMGCTRSVACMDMAAQVDGPVIVAVGNAPTALMRIVELHARGLFDPLAVIGVPVGFVNVVEAKEELMASGIPAIVARGRKGGSNVAAALVNALLYRLTRSEGEALR